MDKVIRDGKVAVLYSPGYGAGWYSWNAFEEILYHPKIVAKVEENKRNEITEKFLSDLGFPGVYCGGVEDLCIAWIPVGTLFSIDEYDGNESVEYAEEQHWITA